MLARDDVVRRGIGDGVGSFVFGVTWVPFRGVGSGHPSIADALAVHRPHCVNVFRPRTREHNRAPDNEPVRGVFDVNQRFSGFEDRIAFLAGLHLESPSSGVLGCVLQSLAAQLIQVSGFIRAGGVAKGPSEERPGVFHEAEFTHEKKRISLTAGTGPTGAVASYFCHCPFEERTVRSLNSVSVTNPWSSCSGQSSSAAGPGAIVGDPPAG